MKIGNPTPVKELLQNIKVLNFILFGELSEEEKKSASNIADIKHYSKLPINAVKYLLKEASSLYINKLYVNCENSSIAIRNAINLYVQNNPEEYPDMISALEDYRKNPKFKNKIDKSADLLFT